MVTFLVTFILCIFYATLTPCMTLNCTLHYSNYIISTFKGMQYRYCLQYLLTLSACVAQPLALIISLLMLVVSVIVSVSVCLDT